VKPFHLLGYGPITLSLEGQAAGQRAMTFYPNGRGAGQRVTTFYPNGRGAGRRGAKLSS